jgi:hypothetical protein
MKQYTLTESQVETLLRALSNESSVDQDLESRRILTPEDIRSRAKARVEIKRLLRGQLTPVVLPEVKRAIDKALTMFDESLVNGLGNGQDDALTAIDSELVQRPMREARAKLYSAAIEFCLQIGLKFSSDSTDKKQTNQEDQNETV